MQIVQERAGGKPEPTPGGLDRQPPLQKGLEYAITVHTLMPTKDPEKKREKARRYYRKHQLEQLRRKAAYRETHREEIRASDLAYRAEHLEEIRLRQRTKKAINGSWARQTTIPPKTLYPERHRKMQKKSFLKYAYGITLDDFEAMLERQEHKCAICQKDFTEELPPCVDHKKDGPVRALLCNHCNLFIGHAAERPDVMRRAAEYLEIRGMAELADAGSGERLSTKGVDRDPEGALMANSPSIEGSSPSPATKTCIHGKEQGYNCWQCGGLAQIP